MMIGTPGGVGLGLGDVIQERDHGVAGVQHGFVHVDVDDLRPVLDLLRATLERFLVLFLRG